MGIDVQRVRANDAPFPLWLVRMPGELSPSAFQLLSIADRERAERFLRPHLCRRYVAAHAARNLLCEAFFGVPTQLQGYVAGAFGKPQLKGDGRYQSNISYAAAGALIGLAFGKPIGVDIEQMRPIEDGADLVALHYTRKEACAIDRATRQGLDQNKAFLRAWVRKEACLKAMGCGLSEPLTSVQCGIGSARMTVRVDSQAVRTGVLHTSLDNPSSSSGDLLIGWAQLA
jgi:4'-phosphopantetheinyl transferase